MSLVPYPLSPYIRLVIARRHEISRLEAFSDAVFAFALTLLVVSLEPPQATRAGGRMGPLVRVLLRAPRLDLVRAQHVLPPVRPAGRLYDPAQRRVAVRVLLYVYPLKFMFDSLFARFLPRLKPPEPLELWQLANAASIYAVGFIAIFVLFALLYRHALASRHELALSELEMFDARTAVGHHLISAASACVAGDRIVGAARPRAGRAHVFCLMGPAHFWVREPLGTETAAPRGTVRRERGTRRVRLLIDRENASIHA